MNKELLQKFAAETPLPDDHPDAIYIKLLRRFLNDDENLNILEGVKESTDRDLYDALLTALDEINNSFTPATNYSSFDNLPNWGMLQLGATLQILTSKGILSSRNTLTYRDSGGVTVQDYDKYGRYINYFNILYNKYMSAVRGWKMSMNISSAYGGSDGTGVPSEYGDYYDNY